MNKIKKNWFVALIAVLFTIAAIYFVVDTNNNKFETKSVDGKSVVYEFEGTDYFADDLYTTLYETYGINSLITYIQNEVFSNAIEPSDDLISEATLQAEADITYLKQYYGEEYETVLIEFLNQYGYSNPEDLQTHYLTTLMAQEVYNNYVEANFDELFDAYAEEKNPRVISHILVGMEDPNNPTDAENEKLNTVKEALAQEDADYALIAEQYSDDTGSAVDGGSLGIVDTDSVENFVPEFKDAVYTVNEGEMTEWIQTDYGMHIIKVDATSKENLKEVDTINDTLLAYYPELYGKILWDECVKQNISFSDNTELEAEIKAALGVE